VIVRLPGAAKTPAIGLAAHYDSVSAGPGAADDLQGVATVIECLRIMKLSMTENMSTRTDDDAQIARRRPLVAVFTDGEEVGLLGARAFSRHPLFAETAVMINVEARGTSGRPQMFEASAGNHRLIGAVARSRRLPMTTSLAYEIYRRMPNDTDLSVWMRAGAQGLNFAFIGGVRRYHTPRDDLAHLDLRSVQLQGEAVLATTQALRADLEPMLPTVDAAYADLFGAILLRWRAPVGTLLAALALLALLAAAYRARRAGDLRIATLGGAFGVLLLTPILAAAGGYGALWLVAALSRPLGAFPTTADAALAMVVGAATCTSLLILRPLALRIGAAPLAIASGILWAAAALAAALLLPGAGSAVLPTALACAVGLLIASGRGEPRDYLASTLIAGALAFALFIPLVISLADAIGLSGGIVGAAVGWMWTAALPGLAAERRDPGLRALLVACLGATTALAISSATAGRSTVDQPARANLIHVSDLDRGEGRIALELPRNDTSPPAQLLRAAEWSEPTPVLPWSGRALRTTRSSTIAADGPELIVHDDRNLDGVRGITATLRARPGSALIRLVIPQPQTLTVQGEALDVATLRSLPNGARVVTIWGPPAAGVKIFAELRDDTPWILADALLGLPDADRAIAQARPEDVVPYRWGDLSVAVREVSP